jgi:hypothetical protein
MAGKQKSLSRDANENLMTHHDTPFSNHNTNSYVELIGITPKQHQNEPTQTEPNAFTAIPQGQI